VKHIITITYKNGETETSHFTGIVIGGTYTDITYPPSEKKPPHGGGIELKQVKEITIK